MESVSFQPVKEFFVFSEVLQELLHGAQMQAKAKQLPITCLNCEDTAMILADISMLERVIQNLLENALKYTPEAGQVIVNLGHDGDKLMITMENSTGLMPAGLTEWLNSTEDNPAERPPHTGLGLALVKRILQLHAFKFHAAAEAGNFLFRIEMPVYHLKS